VNHINEHGTLPEVDSSNQFAWYKQDPSVDVTFEYFVNYKRLGTTVVPPIDYHENHQYHDYSTIAYTKLVPLVKKYFHPSADIEFTAQMIEHKYQLEFDNTCVLFYRGNDKSTETSLSSYEEYMAPIQSILETHPTMKFLLQSDETEFLEYMEKALPGKCFYFKDEIRHIRKSNTTVDKVFPSTNFLFSKYYLAITLLMSKCKYIVCGSGNCSIWMMLFRGHCKNVYQYREGKMLFHSEQVETVEPVVETVEPVGETVEPAAEPVVETVEPVAEPVEPAAEPVVETVVEPVVETVVEPVVETVVEPAAEPAEDPVEP
jgi:hypothetical protein